MNRNGEIFLCILAIFVYQSIVSYVSPTLKKVELAQFVNKNEVPIEGTAVFKAEVLITYKNGQLESITPIAGETKRDECAKK